MRRRSLWRAFGDAFAGLGYVLRTQRNVRVHVVVTAGVVVTGVWLDLAAAEWAILALTIGLVMAAEIGNTALEALVDLASPDFHPLAKTAKDTAAGAVLVAAVTAVVVGLLVLGPPLYERVFG